ncbi:hypothetical protein FOA52_011453 [Chlamydomonas sp. UWO 241]|nr:hypothetical protein FOA52_011453 [Chlamydomonas sp. UWO 241]
MNGRGPFKKLWKCDGKPPYTQWAWTVSLKNTSKECGGEFVYYEQRKFALTSKSIAAIRKALFPQPAHAALSAKLGDYDLMVQPLTVDWCAKLHDYDLMVWLLAAAGYDREGIEHCCDGWDGVMLRRVRRSASAADNANCSCHSSRRVCRSASAEDDADWEPTDFEADMEAQKENIREQRSFERGGFRDFDDDSEGEEGEEDDDGWADFDAKGNLLPQRRREC